MRRWMLEATAVKMKSRAPSIGDIRHCCNPITDDFGDIHSMGKWGRNRAIVSIRIPKKPKTFLILVIDSLEVTATPTAGSVSKYDVDFNLKLSLDWTRVIDVIDYPWGAREWLPYWQETGIPTWNGKGTQPPECPVMGIGDVAALYARTLGGHFESWPAKQIQDDISDTYHLLLEKTL